MFKFIFVALFVLAQSTFALNFKVFGPCQDQALLDIDTEISKSISAGELTVELFNKNHVPYLGATAYMQSIYNTPFGLDAMEVVSDSYMRSHGWVYSVNGNVPDTYPHEVFVTNDAQVIWYFGYVVYDSGVWATEYLYTNKIKPEQFCQ